MAVVPTQCDVAKTSQILASFKHLGLGWPFCREKERESSARCVPLLSLPTQSFSLLFALLPSIHFFLDALFSVWTPSAPSLSFLIAMCWWDGRVGRWRCGRTVQKMNGTRNILKKVTNTQKQRHRRSIFHSLLIFSFPFSQLLIVHSAEVRSCDISHREDLLCTASVDGTVSVWRLRERSRISLQHDGPIEEAKFARDSSCLAVLSSTMEKR
jgi:hypothetical protein